MNFSVLLVLVLGATGMARDPVEEARENSVLSHEAFVRCWRYLHGWLSHRDPRSGLLPRKLNEDAFWNVKDSAADNFPFLVLTASILGAQEEEAALERMLEAEIRLTNRLGNLPDDYQFETATYRFPEIDLERLIFGASEYVKDGLMPLTEWKGDGLWFDRLRNITDTVWEVAPVKTTAGTIPSLDMEVNGEQLQVLCRLYWKTEDSRYRDWAFRIADYYLLEAGNLPTDALWLRLDDHGCEIVDGLAGAYFLASHLDPVRRNRYREPIYRMLDRILEVGVNADGLVYEEINPREGKVLDPELSDNWGYNYNAFLNVALLDEHEPYRAAVTHVLGAIHAYLEYPWEGARADGYADSIEGALNLLNRIPVESAFTWVEESTRLMLPLQREDGIIEGWYGDGNYARTALMVGLWQTQGTRLEPWRPDLKWGASRTEDGLIISIESGWDWRGRLIFDTPRHREHLKLPADYPRINQFPEWFTVPPGSSYRVRLGDEAPTVSNGRSLRGGIELQTKPGIPLFVEVAVRR